MIPQPQEKINHIARNTAIDRSGAPINIGDVIWRCLQSNLSVIPIEHKTKKPLMAALPKGDDGKPTWSPYKERKAHSTEVDAWLALNPQSIAVVFGAVSGNAELLDFDDNPEATPRPYSADEFFDPWWAACGDLVEQYDLPVWRTGGNGYGIAYRCDVVEGNQSLAWVPDESKKAGRAVAIETRGEGGYALVPDSLHPSGERYTMIRGDLTRIATIPVEVRTKFFQVARSLCLAAYTNQEMKAEIRKDNKKSAADGLGSVIATFNAQNDIVGMLERHGYTHAHGDRWRRPDGKSGSVKVLSADNRSFHHSSNDPLYFHTDDGKLGYNDPFRIYTVFEHNGDHEAAFIAAKKSLGLWVEKATAPEMPSWMADAPPQDDRMVDPETGEIMTNEQPVITVVEDETEAEPVNPLNTGVKLDSLKLGWIGEYADLMTTLTCSPRSFNVLGGIVAGSTAIGRTAHLSMSWGDIYTNIYGAIVGPSTGFFKTTSMGKAKLTLRRAELGDRLLPNDTTYEGLIKTLSARPTGVMAVDEIHQIIGSHNIKYQTNLKPALTALYDCESIERALSSGVWRVPEPFLNLYGTTTHSRFHSTVSNLDWMDGFLVRWLFVTAEGEPDHEAIAPMPTTAHDETLDRLARRLHTVSTQRPTKFIFAEETYNTWQRWRIDANKQAWAYGDEVVSYVVGRYATYALKLCMIMASLNGELGVIKPETMQTAMLLVDWFKSNIYQLMEGKRRHSVTGEKLVKVLAIIKRSPGLSTSKLCQLSNMSKAEITPVLEKMIECGYVGEEKASTNGKRYRALVEAIPAARWR